jgi:hypothetical protein
MYVKVASVLSVMSLLFLPFVTSGNYALGVKFLVCAAAVLVAVQATRRGALLWVLPFILVAVAFNPVSPVGISATQAFWMHLVVMAMFSVYVVRLKTVPRMSIASITDRTPGSESL